MGYFEALAQGLGNVLSFPNIMIPIAGTLIAMATSFLPGVGITGLAALLMLATINWEPESVLLLFGALTGGATFMGSITAILFNIPGNSSSAATLLDGHPLSKQGKAKMAIAASATASAMGSVVGVFVLMAAMPIVRPFILEFGPLERLLLGIWGLTTIVAVPNTSALKVLAVSFAGLLAAAIGHDPTTAMPRWSFGSYELFDGLDTIAMLLGFFTISEIIGWRKDFRISEVADMSAGGDGLRSGIWAVFRHYRLMIRSSLIGTVVGIIPGVGGTVAGFVAYGQAIQSAKTGRENFGKGDIRGLIAPESAIDAKDGGSLLPALAFGLPGSEAGIILVTVFMVHGLVPGTPMLTVNLDLTFTLVMALLLSNLLTSLVGVTIAPALARLTRLRIDRIALPVLIASLVTVVQLNGLLIDLYVAVAFGVFGYLLKHFEWPRVPFVIAFVLAGFIESNAALATQLFAVDKLSLFERPAAMVILALIAASLLWMLRQSGQPKDPHPAPPYAILLPSVLAVTSLVFSVMALTSSNGYSTYAIGLAVGATVAFVAVVIREWHVGVDHDRAAGDDVTGAGIPRSHLGPMIALAGFAAAIPLFGLEIAAGVLVALWRLGNTAKGGPLVTALYALLTALTTFYYVERFTTALLPTPIVPMPWY